MLAIWKREVQNYFLTPIGYVFISVFLLLGGFFFYTYNISSASSDLDAMFSNMNYVFMFIVPILTMRLLSEEKRNKTDQLLLTSPRSIWAIVVGKFLAATTVLLVATLISLVYVVIIATYSTPYAGMIVSGYVGFVLLGMCYIAIGVLMSALTENQVSAAVLTLAVNLMLQLLEYIAPSITVPFLSFINTAISWLSLYSRFGTFTAGIFSIANVVYYLSFSGIFLFIAVRVIDKRRWSEG